LFSSHDQQCRRQVKICGVGDAHGKLGARTYDGILVAEELWAKLSEAENHSAFGCPTVKLP